MANEIPLRGNVNAAGGYLLPPEQGEILVNGILVETGAFQIAGDARSTNARKTNFPIWLGRPTAGPVGEGEAKPVTGASFGQATVDIKKFASIVVFTDEQIADVQNGDLSVLVDAGVRQALSLVTDAHAVGLSGGAYISGGSVFNSTLLTAATTGSVIAAPSAEQLKGEKPDTTVQLAISDAVGYLEEQGYGNPDDMAVLLSFGFQKKLRDARDGFGRPLYDGGSFAGQVTDALYNLDRAHSTNLIATNAAALTLKGTTEVGKKVKITERGTAPLYVGQPIEGGEIPAGATIAALVGTAGSETELELSVAATGIKTGETLTVKRPVGVVVHKPNLHVRIRQDVVLSTSNEATVHNGAEALNLWEQNLTAVRYETRLGFMIHDGARAVRALYL